MPCAIKLRLLRKALFPLVLGVCVYCLAVNSYMGLLSHISARYYKMYSKVFRPTGPENGDDTSSSKPKHILFWSTAYKRIYRDKTSRHCEYNNCFLTSNKSILADSDVILFHMSALTKHTTKDLPPQRWPHQRWGLFGRESPLNANFSLYFDEEFNLTLTHKKEADILFAYGTYIPKEAPDLTQANINYAENKTRLVAWVLSTCRTHSRREDYIRELSKHIPVDGYGRCANRTCVLEETKQNKLMVNCESKVAAMYKFYLSFENSLCEGYLTEKVWNKLRYGIVPVVLGNNDYHAVLPPNSFIDVRNFSSPKDLAKYLHEVDKNDALYNSYFAWRTKYTIANNGWMCQLCKYLNTNKEPKVYKNIGQWWQGCIRPEAFYPGIADVLM